MKKLVFSQPFKVGSGWGSALIWFYMSWYVFIASYLFPRILLGFSSGLGAFGGTPKPPHLEYLALLSFLDTTSELINTPHDRRIRQFI